MSDGLDLRPKYSGIVHCMKSVWQQEGLRGLYQGVTPNVWGAGASWGLYFFLYVSHKLKTCWIVPASWDFSLIVLTFKLICSCNVLFPKLSSPTATMQSKGTQRRVVKRNSVPQNTWCLQPKQVSATFIQTLLTHMHARARTRSQLTLNNSS